MQIVSGLGRFLANSAIRSYSAFSCAVISILYPCGFCLF
jgi:hypothetical protein